MIWKRITSWPHYKILAHFVSGHGLEVSIAEDGSQVMEKILFYLPKLVILDLLLPILINISSLAAIIFPCSLT